MLSEALEMTDGNKSLSSAAPAASRFPTAAGIFFGLGIGGFFDGIVLHQILQ